MRYRSTRWVEVGAEHSDRAVVADAVAPTADRSSANHLLLGAGACLPPSFDGCDHVC